LGGCSLHNFRDGIFIFLGAGLSFGVRRARKETDGGVIEYEYEFSEQDDEDRFPSWTQLVNRMKKHLYYHPLLKSKKRLINRFFREAGPLDCAELFWKYTQEQNYWAFLRRQFGSRPNDVYDLTPSHRALTQLPIQKIFTTNYDELIETAYRNVKINPLISASAHDFMDNKGKKGQHHLIKLHGTIGSPYTIVLTRTDYAKSRRDRAEMFRYLANEFEDSTFLFVGFSLQDPNFNILFDDARYAMQGQNPPSYVVQGREDQLREAYLSSLGINTIALKDWNQLPEFLSAINPNIPWPTQPHIFRL
jgi:hypothetical protein